MPLVLVYNNKNDTAGWFSISTFGIMERAGLTVEVIDQYADNFEVIAKLAGPKPEIYVEEVTQLSQGDKDEGNAQSV